MVSEPWCRQIFANIAFHMQNELGISIKASIEKFSAESEVSPKGYMNFDEFKTFLQEFRGSGPILRQTQVDRLFSFVQKQGEVGELRDQPRPPRK